MKRQRYAVLLQKLQKLYSCKERLQELLDCLENELLFNEVYKKWYEVDNTYHLNHKDHDAASCENQFYWVYFFPVTTANIL
jgi:hypothetical protein